MTRHFRFRKDIILSIIIAVIFGVGLYYLHHFINLQPQLADSAFMIWSLRLLLLIYVLLVLVTLRHTMSTYDLERFDPGNRASLRRLMRKFNYRLPRGPLDTGRLIRSFELRLIRAGFQMEFEDSISGRVYARTRSAGLLARAKTDRVMIKKHDGLNILLVDQMLQDCIRFVRSLNRRPSRRNCLVIITDTPDADDTASAAVGVVNFLGKLGFGTLSPLLLSGRHQRLFYPADRTILPLSHRLFQDRIRHLLVQAVREQKKNRRPAQSQPPAEKTQQPVNNRS
ncbi:MAG: hypothetical protein PHP94_05470 [Eubacteriales bacterium]|nr:hypothetical protein [Eubacteriales bacterium]